MDRAATSRALNQALGSFATQVSARTVRRRLQQHGFSARRPWRLPLTQHHRQKRLQWCNQQRTWHQDGRIRVWQHRVKCTLAAYIRHHHISSSPGVMVWGAISYTSRSPLIRIDGTLNSAPHNSGVSQPVTLPLIQALRNPTFQQDNAGPHVAGIVQTFLETENVRLLP
ncbi:transposable element Tcb1 transposase [Trichonephila clavipes]|nr:transposable element Tcb1 transposase [Trichonephila clavipes]